MNTVNIPRLITTVLEFKKTAEDKNANARIKEKAEETFSNIQKYKIQYQDSKNDFGKMTLSIEQIKELDSSTLDKIKSNYPTLVKTFLAGVAVFCFWKIQAVMVLRQLNFTKALQHAYLYRDIPKAIATGCSASLALFLLKLRRERSLQPDLLRNLEDQLYHVVEKENPAFIIDRLRDLIEIVNKHAKEGMEENIENNVILKFIFSRLIEKEMPEETENYKKIVIERLQKNLEIINNEILLQKFTVIIETPHTQEELKKNPDVYTVFTRFSELAKIILNRMRENKTSADWIDNLSPELQDFINASQWLGQEDTLSNTIENGVRKFIETVNTGSGPKGTMFKNINFHKIIHIITCWEQSLDSELVPEIYPIDTSKERCSRLLEVYFQIKINNHLQTYRKITTPSSEDRKNFATTEILNIKKFIQKEEFKNWCKGEDYFSENGLSVLTDDRKESICFSEKCFDEIVDKVLHHFYTTFNDKSE